MIWRNCSPIFFFSSSSSLTSCSSSSHPHLSSRCKFVLVQARPQLINRSRFLSRPSSFPGSEHLPLQGGETPALKPEQPITSPPRSSITHNHLSGGAICWQQNRNLLPKRGLSTCVRTN